MGIRTNPNTQLKRARLAHGWTQRDLAAATGGSVSQASIARLEAGRAEPRPSTRAAIARALGVDQFALFPIEEEEGR
jgi:transcriptional regulator with XRE-family HTH domain